MPVELQLLVWSGVLALVQMLVAAIAANSQVGLPMLAGNRENMPALTGWAMRAKAAHLNMLESLAIFAIFVLVAHVTDNLNAMTLLGAQLFFWGRLAYAIIYVIGIPWLRTLVWFVSIAGMLLVLLQLL
jgi:uncharacterized MAPEG superfamily protein